MSAPLASLVQALAERLRAPLPGHDAFLELSGYKRPDIAQVLQRTPPPRESAVLILLYAKHDEVYTLLMLRPTYPGVHSGQVAFPGGKREPRDADLFATALREFGEETGCDTSAFHVLGALSRVYIPPSDALVTPVVAWTDVLGELKPDEREVAQLIEAPLSELLRPDLLRHKRLFIQVLGREADVPYWAIQGQVVWGATALMIAELRDLLQGLGDTHLP